MTRFLRLLLVPVLVLALGAFVAACGDDDNDNDSASGAATTGTTAAAEAPDELTVYSGRDEELVQPLLDRFSQETGIKLNVRYGDTAELASTIVEEGDNSPADVFFGQDAGALGALQKAGLLADLPQATLDRVDERFRSTTGQWVGASARARIIAYAKGELSEAEVPKSVFDLTDEEWKGKVGWAPTNASFQAFVTAMRKISGDDTTKKWLEDMKANDTKAFEKNGLVRDAIAGGEIELGLINHYYVLQAAAESGDEDYPVGVAFTDPKDPGSLVNVAGGGILKTSEEQEGAAQLLDFLLSDESQRYFLEETQEYPVVSGLPGPEGVPSLEEIDQPDVDLSDLEDLEATLALIEEAGVL